MEQHLAKSSHSNDKDKHRLKTQLESIVKLEREVKLLKQEIRRLEKLLNRPPKEEAPAKPEPAKKLTPDELREQTRKKFADWSKARNKGNE